MGAQGSPRGRRVPVFYDTREGPMSTSRFGGIAMLKKTRIKASEIWIASAELYRDMALSALRLVRR